MLRGIAGTVGELFTFLWRRKSWWLGPVVVLLLILGVLIVLGTAAGIGPFVYTLF